MRAPIRVLYVDDNPHDRDLVHDALEHEDQRFVVTAASSRSEFLSLLQADRYDLVLSDFNILGFEGLQVLEAVHQVDTNLPVVIVTGTGSEEIAVEAMKRGAADYVIKSPSQIHHLPATLLSALEISQSRQQIKTLEGLIQSALDSLSAHIAILDEQGTILVTNTSWNRFAIENGLADETYMVGRNYLEVCDQAEGSLSTEAPIVAAGIRAIIAGTQTEVSLEYPCHSSLVKRWFIIRARRMGTELPVRVVISHENITSRKLAEEALRESEERLRIALESAHIGIFDWDLSTNTITWNQEHERLYGFAPGTFPGTYDAFEQRLHPEDVTEVRNDITRVRETGAEFERTNRVIWPDGSLHWIWGNGRFLYDREGRPIRMVGVVRDVSEQIKTEKEIIRARDFYLTLFDEFPGMIWRSGPNGDFDFFNQGWLDFTGRTLEEETYEPREEGVHPDDRGRYLALFYGALAKREPFEIEYRRLRHDGEYRWLMGIGRPFKDLDGHFGGFIGYCFDVTDRHNHEDDLRQLSTAIEQVAEPILITDVSGTIRYVNPAFERITGYSRDEALGSNPRILRSGQHPESFYTEMWETILAGHVWDGHFLNKRKDGVVIEEEAHISPVRNQTGEITHFIAVNRDVTNERELERRLHQFERMDAIGHLAGGIAHDFNNMLQVIMAYGQFLRRDLAPGSSGHQDVDRILDACDEAVGLTRQLLTFSRSCEAMKAPLDIRPIIKEVIKLLERTLPSSISITHSFVGDLPRIIGDPTQIHQVLVNLCVNSRDALPHGGDIHLTARPFNVSEDFAREHPDASVGDHLLLSVADTGEGIAPEVLPRIFDPFFTTKGEGKGTGLGLSTVYGIIRQHGGFLDCISRLGEGTVFNIYLPTHKGPSQEDAPVEIPVNLPGGTETILIADDQAMIRHLVQRTLEDLGYTVVTAKTGREAVQIFDKHHEEIDLVVLDIQMPEMDGLDACEMILKTYPATRIILSSGYIDEQIEARIENQGAQGFLSKPYNEEDLAVHIREVLDRDEGSEDGCVTD